MGALRSNATIEATLFILPHELQLPHTLKQAKCCAQVYVGEQVMCWWELSAAVWVVCQCATCCSGLFVLSLHFLNRDDKVDNPLQSLAIPRCVRFADVIVWTAGHSTLLTVFKDDFFCVFTSVFDLSNWSSHATGLGSIYLKSLRNNKWGS